MNNKKVASLGLALTMIANAVPALATETPVEGGHEANVEHAGERPTEAEVCATQTVDADDTAACTVYAEVGSEFTVTIPKSLTLSGADKTGAYTVAVEGDIAGDQFVSVTPDENFAMVQDGKADVTATITQEITKFRGDDYKEALVAGEAKFADGAEGAIDAQGLSAGAWNGTFNFNIKLEGGTGAGTEDPVTLEAGLYDADGVMVASWDEAGIDVTTDYTYNNHKTSIASGYTVLNKPEYTSTTKIVLPENLTTISNYAFANCTNLTSIVIPEGVINIGTYTFKGCTGLMNIDLPESTVSIGDWAFSDTGLTNVVIPKGITTIGDGVYSSCPNLLTIKVDEENTVYDSRNNCNAIIETATNTLIQGCKYTEIPSNITCIGERAFSKCIGLTNVVIPNSVTLIDMYAFKGSTDLISVTIPNSVTSIEEGAFDGCTGLTSIEIPESVTSIGWYAFDECTKLTNVTFKDTTTWYVGESKGATTTQVSVTNASTNAINLKDTYEGKYWTKK